MEEQGNKLAERLTGVEAEAGKALFELEIAACMRRLPGRETFLVDLAEPERPRSLNLDGDAAGVELDAVLPAVVKRFAASDGPAARAELLAGRLPRSPAQREAENLSALLSLGLRVPEPLLWCESGAASLLIMEYLPHRATLRQLLERADPGAGPWVDELAEMVAVMHAAGWYHRDLYLEHVVLLDDGQLGLLDAGRARCGGRLLGTRSRWFVKDLAALSCSAPPGAERQRLAFMARYFTELGEGLSRGAKRRFITRVQRHARRMLAHVPRHTHGSGGGAA